MTVRHLRNSFWQMFIATILTSLFITGCGREGDGDTDLGEGSELTDGSGLDGSSSGGGAYTAAGNINLDQLETKLEKVPGADEAGLIDALRILNNPNASNQQISQAMAEAFRQLMLLTQLQGVDRQKANALIQKLAAELTKKSKELAKAKKKANIMAGVKSIFGMLVNAAVQIVGMFKK